MNHQNAPSRTTPDCLPAGDVVPTSVGHWHCRAFRDDVAGFDESDTLCDLFIDAFVSAGEPTTMAVFKHRHHGNGYAVHWFSPAAQSVAQQWHAIECEQPASRDGLSLLLGDDDAWRVLFPFTAAATDHRLGLVREPAACSLFGPLKRAEK